MVDDEVIARLNPSTGEVENIEILFYSARLMRGEQLQLPFSAHIRGAAKCRCVELVRHEIVIAPRPVQCDAALDDQGNAGRGSIDAPPNGAVD